jgi:hypothetical protein
MISWYIAIHLRFLLLFAKVQLLHLLDTSLFIQQVACWRPLPCFQPFVIIKHLIICVFILLLVDFWDKYLECDCWDKVYIFMFMVKLTLIEITIIWGFPFSFAKWQHLEFFYIFVSLIWNVILHLINISLNYERFKMFSYV